MSKYVGIIFSCFINYYCLFTAKNGIEPSEASNLVEYVLKNCPNLNFQGLMTIGQYDYDTTLGPNPDFLKLAKCRQEVCEKLNLDINNVELSMGMSTDFEHAVCVFKLLVNYICIKIKSLSGMRTCIPQLSAALLIEPHAHTYLQT